MLAKYEASVELRNHVLLTEPGAEFKAQRHLKASGFDPYVPSEQVTQFRSIRSMFGVMRRKYDVVRPIFRGYLILPLNLAWSFGPLYTTPGLRQRPFLVVCGKPAIMQSADVEKLRGAEKHLKDAPVQGLPYKVGDMVRITDGPFLGFAAEISKLDDSARIELLMDMLGAQRKTHLTARQIEQLD